MTRTIFFINNVAIQNDGKDNLEKVYFKDKAKSKKGYKTFPLFKNIKKAVLKKITTHGLKHSIATLLHLEGVNIRDLQDWLGHENISSTNIYTRSDYKKQVQTGKVVM